MNKPVLYITCWLALLLLGRPGFAQIVDAPGNLAINKPATATSVETNYIADKAVDNIADAANNSRWSSNYAGLTQAQADSNSMYINLLGDAVIKRVDLYWEVARGLNFKIEVSNNAVNWTVVAKITNNQTTTNSIPVAYPTGLDAQGRPLPTTYRYVRMHGLKRATQYGYSLIEFQVFGTLTSTPLPVSLSAFSATLQSAGVALHWATATEQQNAGFQVQRSADGGQFADLAFVPGAGNSQRPLSYDYLDAQPLRTATNYYRLKQIDANGTFTYSPVRAVSSGGLPTGRVFPNPARAQTTFEWQAAGAGAGRWYLTNALGQVVHAAALTEQAGYNSLTIDLQPYAAGSYVLTIEGAGPRRQRARLQKTD